MAGGAVSASGQVLLGVFAHPDDESLACGGLFARAAAAGAAVTLLCLTRGEGGPGAPADVPDEAEARRQLGVLRTQELDAAARVLGLSDVQVLDHADGMLPWIAPALLEADIRASIERLRPDVVVTFGADGLYWHPDHVAAHERTTAVVAALGAAAPALCYVTMPPGQMRAVAAHAGAGGVVPGLDDMEAFGAHAAPPTHVVDAGPFAVRKLAALHCHRSQMTGSPLARLTPEDAALIAVEHYHRAAVGAAGPCLLDAFAVPA